jgi:hypothetical protein
VPRGGFGEEKSGNGFLGAAVPEEEEERFGEERTNVRAWVGRERETTGLFPLGCCWAAASGRPKLLRFPFFVLLFFSIFLFPVLLFELAKLI